MTKKKIHLKDKIVTQGNVQNSSLNGFKFYKSPLANFIII